ncbi:MAG: 2-C-methyl-D-erythritol 2,4-cyclodiphosphate synthase [Desulfobacterales bacterium]|nr:2-C-methyl-D-erythritol 2,4-cyclodiphosphate synthase [Desulfobacterales bacterium]MDJ0913698.1 2-C-methyl-D-erythritol 2,4-cyclodiphosphate synthase [Desulfobacterales bacterium]
MRVGMGYDIHRLVAGRKLVLGGITIPFEKGLLGHSDADVVIHALCDALLGAACMGDIGTHFPDTDAQYKDISSDFFLRRVNELLLNNNFAIENIDITILAQAPKLLPYREAMHQKMSQILALASNRLNIKATTAEGLGAIGSHEAIAAMAITQISTIQK